MSDTIGETVRTYIPRIILEHLVHQHQELVRRDALLSEARAINGALRTASSRQAARYQRRRAELREMVAALPKFGIDILSLYEGPERSILAPIREGNTSAHGKTLFDLVDATIAALVKPAGTSYVAGFKRLSIGSRKYGAIVAAIAADSKLTTFHLALNPVREFETALGLATSSILRQSIEISAKTAAVYKGAIGVPSDYIRSFFPEQKEPFDLTDRYGNNWSAHIASNKISKGITELVRREDERFTSGGKQPFGNGDRIMFLRLPDRTYYIELHKTAANAGYASQKAVGVPLSVRPTSLSVRPTLLAHKTVNIPSEYIGTSLPAEGVDFILQDRTGHTWDTAIESKKMSRGIGTYIKRENARLRVNGEQPIAVNDTLVLTPHKGVYLIEVQR